MGQIYRIKLNANSKLLQYEEKILLRYGKELILPLTIVREDNEEYLGYLADGYVPLNNYSFNGLESVFAVLHSAVDALLSAQRHLLDPARFLTEPDKVLVSTKDGRAVPLFGRERQGIINDNFCGRAEGESLLILPIINYLSQINGVECVKEAMDEVQKNIRGKNPGLIDILRIIKATNRNWSKILPTYFNQSSIKIGGIERPSSNSLNKTGG